MKSVFMSIHPKWCELIASGKKTIEVRKTKPNIETPFKCYIYCTHNNRKNAIHLYINSGYGEKEIGVIGHWRSGKDVVDVNHHLPAYRYNAYLAEGKVIGEFVCDEIDTYDDDTIHSFSNEDYCRWNDFELNRSCIHPEDFENYANDKWLYGWHISGLKIYDKPKELNEFGSLVKAIDWEGGTVNLFKGNKFYKPMKRPPVSWCYVEEIES